MGDLKKKNQVRRQPVGQVVAIPGARGYARVAAVACAPEVEVECFRVSQALPGKSCAFWMGVFSRVISGFRVGQVVFECRVLSG